MEEEFVNNMLMMIEDEGFGFTMIPRDELMFVVDSIEKAFELTESTNIVYIKPPYKDSDAMLLTKNKYAIDTYGSSEDKTIVLKKRIKND
jgi:16S rRNA G966 N2-methylase RsmD